ncbi:MAG TPA: hypothetical protein VEQ16_10015, partial [Acidocella sp.]|nr:hypothetical protein [Acidocella sp.]
MNPIHGEPRDRFNSVYTSTKVNGIDFVELVAGHADQLRVHFINAVQPLETLQAAITGGDSIPSVAVAASTAADWSQDSAGR